jgi:uncharacterized protein YhbP (UPF0306 family)
MDLLTFRIQMLTRACRHIYQTLIVQASFVLKLLKGTRFRLTKTLCQSKSKKLHKTTYKVKFSGEKIDS